MEVVARQSTLTWAAASAAVTAALRQAEVLGATVNVAVVDRGGLTVAFLRMPGAPLHSIEIAIDKAYTAASFGLPTGEWLAELERHHSPSVRLALPLRPRLVMFGGGLPIVAGGERVGGIGVSGGSEEQDLECARAGLAALGLG